VAQNIERHNARYSKQECV